jgi:chromosome segregation ATPase
MTTCKKAHIRSMVMVAFLLPGLCACTVIQLKKDVEGDEIRIANKEAELKTEEARQAQLREEITQLQKDLGTRQVTLDDLQSRLAQLQRANANTLGTTKEQRAIKQQREVKLKAHQKELVEIQQSDATLAEKRKKLEHLKEEIRKSLNLLVHS